VGLDISQVAVDMFGWEGRPAWDLTIGKFADVKMTDFSSFLSDGMSNLESEM
jgi:hypothetical protein